MKFVCDALIENAVFTSFSLWLIKLFVIVAEWWVNKN